MMRVMAPVSRPSWREVLASAPGALPEQSPEWIDAMVASGRYDDASRLYELRDGRRLVLPLVRRRGWLGGWLGSFPAGWGIGGPVGDALDASVLRRIVGDLAGLRATRIVVRPDPLTAGLWHEAVAGLPVTAVGRRAHVLDLSGGREAVEGRLAGRTRRSIRTAERRGVVVETDGTGRLLPQYYQLFLRSVDRWAGRQQEPLALARWRAGRRDPLDKLYALSEAMRGGLRVSIAFVEGRPAAGVIVLRGRTAHYTRGAMDREIAGPSRASFLAQWTAISEAIDAGCTAYHMGESGDSASLAAYKEQFGARSVTYAEYRLERLPITRADDLVRAAAKRALGVRDV